MVCVEGARADHWKEAGGKVVGDRVTRSGAKEQTATALVQREVKNYGKQAAPRNTAVSSERSRGHKEDRPGRDGSVTGGRSSIKRESRCSRDQYGAWVLSSTV